MLVEFALLLIFIALAILIWKLFFNKSESLEGNDVKNILFDTTFISQTTTLSTQLSQFQKQDNNLSLVVDEYGEIQGLLTMEDIFTEIVGKFGAAKAELEKEFLVKKDGTVIADGNSKIRELNKLIIKWSLKFEK